MSRSINLGMPVVLSSPNTDVSRRLVAGATHLVATDPALSTPWNTNHTPRSSWLRRLISRKAK